jgi:hypothetical protein
MVLDPKQTTVAYRCPKCGAGVMSVVGLFNLCADMVKLKCDCGESEMSIVYNKDSKMTFTVPCIFCPKPHQYTVSSNLFFGKDLFTLSCHYTGVNIAMMGDTNAVKAELARSELELLDMLEKSGLEDLEGLKGEETLSDPQVLEILLYVIKELDEEGRIRCRGAEGEEHEYEIEFLKSSMLITCKQCGASREIPTQSLIDAHEFLNADELVLE